MDLNKPHKTRFANCKGRLAEPVRNYGVWAYWWGTNKGGWHSYPEPKQEKGMYNVYKVGIETRDPKSGYKKYEIYLHKDTDGVSLLEYKGNSLRAGLAKVKDKIIAVEAEESK